MFSYKMTMDVITSWERMKREPEFKSGAGQLIFTRLFELDPACRKAFKYQEHEDIRKNPLFKIHSQQMVAMINSSVELLGPDLELLENDLFEIGARHIRYGVKMEYLPVMTKAIDYALTCILKDHYTAEIRKAWEAVFGFMVSRMIQGMKEATYKMTLDVTMSWNALKRTKNYKEVAGTLIYNKLFELLPESQEIFNNRYVGCDVKVKSRESSLNIFAHSQAIVYMIDRAVGLLGADLGPLDDSLIQLGKRHVQYGVRYEYLPYMGQAVDFALAEILGCKYTRSDKESWEIVIDYMISKMTVGMIC